jgi:CubicO group peptidase (beta-lactamase class C family)
MIWMRLVKSVLALAIGVAWFCPLLALDAAPPVNLEGVWGAARHFGPAVRGTLTISDSHGSWRAQIDQYDLPVVSRAGRVEFELPGSKGSFAGRMARDGVIRGYWVQPPTQNDGSKFASPVVLRPSGRYHWAGEVVPREDDFTLYLAITRRSDGSLGAFIRNPDRNIGRFWDIDHVERDGNRIKLMGKFRGRGDEVVLGEGVLYPADQRISIYFADRGGTFDFTPIGDDPTPGFYARGKNPPPYEYRPPAAEDDGWKVGTLAEVGMVPEPIADFVRMIETPDASMHDPAIHGLIVARHGKLVVEEYFHGFHRLEPHDTRSAAKSVTATLVGAVMQSGARLDVSTHVYNLLYHGAPPADMDPRKKDMTVEHLLTMSSGYDCDDNKGDRPGSEDTLLDTRPDDNYYRYTLQLPMELAPGAEAVYCSINPNLLGAVLTVATGKPVTELFQDLLAGPMQIKQYYLNLQPTGEPYMGGGVKFLPRDFMKFGQLMLNDGMWNGKRILSKTFVRRASSPFVQIRGTTDTKYGYLWWTRDYPYQGRTVRAYLANGNGGQFVVVIPELDMVIESNAGNYADRVGSLMIREYIPKYILPALRGPAR